MASGPDPTGRDPATGASIPVQKADEGEAIPARRKPGSSWLPWLLGLLSLAALIFLLLFFLGNDEEVDVIVEGEIETVEPVATPGITIITTLDELQSEPLTHVGTDVGLPGVEVTRLTGDATFALGEGEMDYLVVLNEDMDQAPPMVEGRYDVAEDQVIEVTGEVRAAEDLDLQAWDVTGQEAQELRENGVFLWANSLEVLERSS